MRRPTAPARILATALLLGAVVTPLAASAQQPAWMEADARFKHGVALFNEKNFVAAMVEFQRAYAVDPKYQVLYNIAECYFAMQDYANALKSYQKYLADGGTKISPKRRKDVEAQIDTLLRRVATLTITTSEPGAAVTVDDVAVGTTPFAAITVSAGRRKITATLAGRVPVTQVVELAGGDQRTLELLIPAAPGPNLPPPPPKEGPPLEPMIITWSITGALVTGAVITGALALGASSDLEAELGRFPGNADALASAQDKAFGLGLATDILIGTSVAMAAVSTYFTVDFLLESDAAPPATPPKATARFLALPGGVAVAGTF